MKLGHIIIPATSALAGQLAEVAELKRQATELLRQLEAAAGAQVPAGVKSGGWRQHPLAWAEAYCPNGSGLPKSDGLT